jgi:hypothetical protein
MSEPARRAESGRLFTPLLPHTGTRPRFCCLVSLRAVYVAYVGHSDEPLTFVKPCLLMVTMLPLFEKLPWMADAW